MVMLNLAVDHGKSKSCTPRIYRLTACERVPQRKGLSSSNPPRAEERA